MATKIQRSAAYLLQEGDIFKAFEDSPWAYKVTGVIKENGMILVDSLKAVHGLNTVHVTDIVTGCQDFWPHDNVYLLTETA